MIGNHLEPFKFWCQKVLPNVYDDSLSYYEYLCKLNEYLNEVIGQINTLTDNMSDYETDLSAQWLDYKTDLTNQWTETKNYIDHYFDNLDVQTEINNKLDEMATDGSLSNLIAPQLPNIVADWLSTHLTPTEPTIDNTLSVSGAGADARKTGLLMCSQYSSTNTYKVHDVCLHNGTLYECKTEITEGEEWNSEHWRARNMITLHNFGFLPRVMPSGTTSIASIREQGVYYIPRENLSDFNDLPTGHANEIATVFNFTNCYGGFTYQYYMNLNNKIWRRLINSSTGAEYNTWSRVDNLDIVVDPTLSVSGYCADAQKTGLLVCPQYSASSTYNVHDIVLYNGTVYECKTEITVAENWNSSHWTATNIGTLHNASFTPRVMPSGNTSIANIRKQGVYYIAQSDVANLTDAPTGIQTAISTVVNITNCYGSFTYQYFMQLNDKIWRRLINTNNGSVYSDWIRYDNVDVFKDRTTPSTVTQLALLVKEGVYNIDSSYMPNITDKPTTARPNEVSTLINITNCYSGAFITQIFLQLSGLEWRRIIQNNGTIYKDWELFPSYACKDILFGKKLVTAGDSYTEARFTGDISAYNGKNFGYYIAQRNNMKFVNDGISGSTIAEVTDGSTDDRHPFSVQRYLDVPADTDYLTIWFGINDKAHCTLGTISDTTSATFYGAWNKVLNYYLTNRPFMKVLLVVTTGANASFRQAVRDVAEKWGYPYLDWEKDVQIPAFFDRTGMSEDATLLRRDAFGYNGPVSGHPNPQWHEYASSIFEAKLRSI